MDNELYEVDTAPSPEAARAYQVSTAICDAANYLAYAGQSLAHARRHGANDEELAAAFGCDSEFLSDLHQLAIRRMLGHLNGEIQLRDDRVAECKKEQAEFEELMTKLQNGDTDVFRQLAKEGF